MSGSEIMSGVAARLDELRASNGDTVDIADVGEIVVSLMTTIEGDLGVADLRVHRELKELLDYISRARREIATIRPDRIRSESIQVATDELDAVVTATEEATGKFLDAAETLESLASELDSEVSGSLNEVATQIYEASNFQDITGQVIRRVIQLVEDVEKNLIELLKIFGKEEERRKAATSTPDKKNAGVAEGPIIDADQRDDVVGGQDEVDDLLSSLGF